MRDAESLLDQVLAYAGDRVTAEAVREAVGLADDDADQRARWTPTWPATRPPPWTASRRWPMAAATWRRSPPRPRSRRAVGCWPPPRIRRGAPAGDDPAHPGRGGGRGRPRGSLPAGAWSCWRSSRRRQCPSRSAARSHRAQASTARAAPIQPPPSEPARCRPGRSPRRGRQPEPVEAAGRSRARGRDGRPLRDGDVAGIRGRWADVVEHASPGHQAAPARVPPGGPRRRAADAGLPRGARLHAREGATAGRAPSSSCSAPCSVAPGRSSASPATWSSSR